MAGLNKFQRAIKPVKPKATFTRPEGAGNFDNMDDHNIVKSVSTLQGTIQHIPTLPKDIVNKAYVDLLFEMLTQNYTTIEDNESNQLQYTGWADPGSEPSNPVWRIRRTIFDGTGDGFWEWADGNDDFDNKWTDRTTLSYS